MSPTCYILLFSGVCPGSRRRSASLLWYAFLRAISLQGRTNVERLAIPRDPAGCCPLQGVSIALGVNESLRPKSEDHLNPLPLLSLPDHRLCPVDRLAYSGRE